MLFFKRILKQPAGGGRDAIVRKERRGTQRLAISPAFPLKAVLSFDRRGGTVAPMGGPRGSDWPGRLINVSEVGARIRLVPAALTTRGDICELRLGLEGFRLTVPCRITNVRVEQDGIHFGLKHEFDNETAAGGYRQLLEIVALGATLKPQPGKAKPDDSGYLVEQFVGAGPARLVIWRDNTDRTVTAFEFVLKDCIVRASRGWPVEYLSGADAAHARRATPAKGLEIQRLFNWVLPNLAPAVPEDVRKFLLKHAG